MSETVRRGAHLYGPSSGHTGLVAVALCAAAGVAIETPRMAARPTADNRDNFELLFANGPKRGLGPVHGFCYEISLSYIEPRRFTASANIRTFAASGDPVASLVSCVANCVSAPRRWSPLIFSALARALVL